MTASQRFDDILTLMLLSSALVLLLIRMFFGGQPHEEGPDGITIDA